MNLTGLWTALMFLGVGEGAGSNSVAHPDPGAVRLAIENGGTVTLAFDGTVKLSETVVVVTNTTVDATGRTISLDGGQALRHFVVTNGATLRLINLTLANGRFVGSKGDTNQPGNPGCGGSILNSGGRLELIGCQFLGNQAIGGMGGPDDVLGSSRLGPTGGPGYGGAIYSVNGHVGATNCLFRDNVCTGGEGLNSTSFYTGGGGDAFGGAIYSTNGVLRLVAASFATNAARGGEMSGGRANLT